MTENENIQSAATLEIPVLPLRGLCVFPNTAIHLDAQREMSVKAVQYAITNNVPVLLLTQIDVMQEKPKREDFYDMGTIATVKNLIKLPNNCVRVLVDAKVRGFCGEIYNKDGMLFTKATAIESLPVKRVTKKNEAEIRSLKDMYAEYFRIIGRISPDVINKVISLNDIDKLTDTVGGSLIIDYDDKQYILETLDPKKRLTELLKILAEEINLLNIEIDIQSKVKAQLDKNHRDYYLREQMKMISEELGEEEDIKSKADDYEQKLSKLNLDTEAKEKIEKEISRFSHLPPYSQEASVARTYLDTVFDLPWNRSSKEKLNMKRCVEILDADHYGLKDVKTKILEYLSARMINPDIKAQILCLYGPPGVGKTSVVRSVAKALGRKYQRISLGGVHDEAEIRGHRKTYVGSMPGKIMSAVRSAGVNNPLILLDEIDKLASDYKGDPASALLEALDSEQNFSFCDNYIDLPFDLSKVLFITTANSLDTIPLPLLDRMDVISLSGYTRYEKFRIAKDHLLKKQYKEHKITKRQINITDDALYTMIDFYVREAGVRSLERTIVSLIRKAEKKYLEDEKPLKIDSSNIEEFLGRKKYTVEKRFSEPQIGAAMGLAWTMAGGDTLFCEAVCVDGTGKIDATGSLGDVMKESTKIAVTHIRTISKSLGIDKDFYKNKDIFIHFPDGATPKDGPSAGITIALAVTSALTNRKIRCDVAMTGEISIRGNVLPIGGLKEKSLAAHRVGIRNIIIPKDNEKDIEDIPEEIRSDFNFMPVSRFSEVLEIALLPEEKSDPKSEHPILTEIHKYNVIENKI